MKGMTDSDRARRPPVSPAVLDLLDRSMGSLVSSARAGDTAERYLHAHLGALRAAAALLALRPAPGGRGAGRLRSVWELLPLRAPELTEWASFFAGSARRRAQVERGEIPTVREADDLLRQAVVFAETVEELVGVPTGGLLGHGLAAARIADRVAPCSPRSVVRSVVRAAG